MGLRAVDFYSSTCPTAPVCSTVGDQRYGVMENPAQPASYGGTGRILRVGAMAGAGAPHEHCVAVPERCESYETNVP